MDKNKKSKIISSLQNLSNASTLAGAVESTSKVAGAFKSNSNTSSITPSSATSPASTVNTQSNIQSNQVTAEKPRPRIEIEKEKRRLAAEQRRNNGGR